MPARTPPPPAPAVAPEPEPEAPVTRLVVCAVPAPARRQTPLAGPVLVTDDGGGVAPLVVGLLERSGVSARLIAPGDPAGGPAAAVLHLAPLAGGRSLPIDAWQDSFDFDVSTLFTLVKELERDLRAAGGAVLVASRLGGRFGIGERDFCPTGGGPGGFVKSLAREWPEGSCKSLDFEFEASNKAVAEAIVAELHSRDEIVEIGYHQGLRLTLRSVPAPLEGAPAVLKLGHESVVVITGGARGITAEIGIELARRFAPTLVLLGRSPLPPGQDPADVAALEDAREIKAALMKRPGQQATPAVIEAAYRRLMQEREIRGTLKAMRRAGSAVEYHGVDVTNAAAVRTLIEDLYRRLGRIDGVIHGAGVIEDKLVRDKTLESFRRVVQPKVAGALALVSALRPDSLAFLSFFSSVSARYGNRGQGDYAAANEVLNKLALWLNARWPGRVFSINWGPWKTEGGMVSAELAAQFAKAGVEMIGRASGRQAFLQELVGGAKGVAEVVYGGPLFEAKAAEESLPFLCPEADLKQVVNGSVQVVRETGPKTDLYLLDHQLDGKPVLPMVMAMELMAETAAANSPGLEVAAIRGLKVLRGITFENGSGRLLRVEAHTRSAVADAQVVDVKLASDAGLHYAAQVELRRFLEKPKITSGLVLNNRRPLSVPAAYQEWLFHGPLFAGIGSVEAVGENGILARLRRSRPERYFSYRPRSEWILDPMVADSGLQLIILWARTFLDMTTLPSRLTCCHRYAPLPDQVRCEAHVEHRPGSSSVRTDIRFFDDGGRLVAWLEGMEFTCSKALNRLGSWKAAPAEAKL